MDTARKNLTAVISGSILDVNRWTGRDTMKVGFLDKRVFRIFLQLTSGASAALSTVLLFVDIPDWLKIPALIAFALALFGTYFFIWTWLCCTNLMRDSSCESSVVAGGHEQTHTPRLQDQELARLSIH